MRVSFARGSNTLSFQIFEATKRDVYLDSRVVSHELGGVEPLRLFSVRPVLVIEQVFQLLYSSLIGCRRERERERERMHLVSLRAERTQFAALFEIRFKNRFAFFLERKKANEEDELERKKERKKERKARDRVSCRPVSSPIRVSGGPLPCSRAASFFFLSLFFFCRKSRLRRRLRRLQSATDFV